MAHYELWCSPDLAAKLGAHPATEIPIKGCNTPLYVVPNKCVAIHVSGGILIWPLVRKDQKDAKDTKNG